MNGYNISRIISGFWIYRYQNKIYTYSLPSRELRFFAEQVYLDCYDKAIYRGLYTEQTIIKELLKQKTWSKQQDKDLNLVQKEIDDAKVDLFNKQFQSEQKRSIRQKLETLKNKYSELYRARHSLDYLTAEYTAGISKFRFLIGAGLKADGVPYWQTPMKEYANSDNIVEYITNCVTRDTLNDNQLRQLVKSDEWKMYSNFKDCLPCNALDLNDEQRNFFLWHYMYQNIYSNPSCPNDSIIQDDDALDGWIIVQKRERDKEKAQVDEKHFGEKMIIVDTQEDANKVYAMNSFEAQVNLNKRFKALNEKRVLHEAEMPDSRQRIEMEINAKRQG